MKIAYLHQYFNTPDMSGSTRSYEIARRLAAAGHEVEIFTAVRNPQGRRKWFTTREGNFTVHWLPVPYSNHMGFRRRVTAFLQFALHVDKRVAISGADLVFASSTPLTIAIPAVRAAKALRVPMVFEVRDLWPEMPIAIGDLANPLLIGAARELERYAYRNAERIIALSPGMADGVVRAGYPRDRIHVIPNSCDVDMFTGPHPPVHSVVPGLPGLQDRKLVVYCGTLGRLNGVSYLVDIADSAWQIDKSIHFLIVGSGAQEEAIRTRAKMSGALQRNLTVHSSVRKRDVPAILGSASLSLSLFVDIPQMQINSANKFFDTLAAGRPIGINYGGWQADLIERRGLGLRIPPHNAPVAARAISSFLSNAQLIRASGRNALQTAIENFDRDKLTTEFETALIMAYAGHAERGR